MKRHIDWLLAVFGIFGTAYGGYLVLWHYGNGNGIHFLGMLLLVLGVHIRMPMPFLGPFIDQANSRVAKELPFVAVRMATP